MSDPIRLTENLNSRTFYVWPEHVAGVMDNGRLPTKLYLAGCGAPITVKETVDEVVAAVKAASTQGEI